MSPLGLQGGLAIHRRNPQKIRSPIRLRLLKGLLEAIPDRLRSLRKQVPMRSDVTRIEECPRYVLTSWRWQPATASCQWLFRETSLPSMAGGGGVAAFRRKHAGGALPTPSPDVLRARSCELTVRILAYSIRC